MSPLPEDEVLAALRTLPSHDVSPERAERLRVKARAELRKKEGVEKVEGVFAGMVGAAYLAWVVVLIAQLGGINQQTVGRLLSSSSSLSKVVSPQPHPTTGPG